MIVEKFECYDKYEAEKLAGFLTMDNDSFAYLRGITKVFRNEVVFALKDKSSHSVIFRDNASAVRLDKTVKDSLIHNKKISSKLNGRTIEITIS